MRGLRRGTRLGVVLLTAALLGLAPALPAAAEGTASRTYPGPAFSPDFTGSPTRTGSQHKLWYYAGAWWGLLLEPTGRVVRVHELMPDHTWRPTSAVVNPDAAEVGDALLDGGTVHVVSRRSDASLHYVRLTFDPAARDYRADPPLLVPTRGPAAPATIVRDGTGRLWVAFATAARVLVTYSDDDGRTWARNIVLASRDVPEATEAAALVPYDDRIGVLWSDQTSGSFEFASHRDGDPPTLWSREQALPGPGRSSDHVNIARMRREGTPDTLVAVVRTAPEDATEPPDAPAVQVLVRAPDGQWSATPVATVADELEDPIVAVDEATWTVHVFAAHGGSIVTKQAPLDDLRFPPGVGQLFVLGDEGDLTDPTSSRAPIGGRSGIVVLANDPLARTYRHAEMALPLPVAAEAGDTTPPTAPEQVQGRALTPGTVILSWAEAADGASWAPARDRTPVREYVVLRDGVEVATTATPSFQDTARAEDGATAEASVEYQVVAVDHAGNRSEPARVVVDLPAAETGTPTPRLVALGLLPLAAVAGIGYVVSRRRRQG